MSVAGAAPGGSTAARDRATSKPSLDPRRRRRRRAIDDSRSHADTPLREARLPEPALSAKAQRHKHPIRAHDH